MAVTVNTTRKAVEIAWDELGESAPTPEPPEEQPPGFPTHPIYLPPYVDASPPTDQPRPDHELPGDQPYPDQGLPGDQPVVEHPIYLPPYVDNSLPGEGLGIWGPTDPRPSHPIELPPDVEEGLTDEQIEKIKAFLEGNLPPTGGPELPTPVKGEKGGKQIAVQIFAQGQEGDWSNTAVMPNDGLGVLTYPEDFTGESYVEVRALDGALVDSGTITVE